MVKKAKIAVWVLIILLFTAPQVTAADALYRMLHGEQDVIVLGEFTDEKQGYLEMRVIRTFQGTTHEDTILVEDDFTYDGFTKETGNPYVGDYAILSLNRSGAGYSRGWFMARADSGHTKALSIYFDPEAFKNPADLAAIQCYINSNGKQKDFYFEEGRVYAKRNLRSDVDVTDIPRAWSPEAEFDVSYEVPIEAGIGVVPIGTILSGIMVLFFVVVIYIRIRAVFLTMRRRKP
jgi:hypothetical protein